MTAVSGGYFGDLYLKLIPNNPVQVSSEVVESAKLNCCSDFVWRVLADSASNDEFKNDVNSFLYWFNKDAITTAKLYLVYDTNISVLLENNNDYGTPFDYGFKTNGQNEKLVGYKLEWKKVLEDLGEKVYYIRCDVTDIFGSTTQLKSESYCLKQYTQKKADQTVKIEYYLNGILGVNENDESKRDLVDLNWYNSHRFEGNFIYSGSTYKTDYIQYESGQRQFIEDEQEIEYTLTLKPIPAFKHDILRTDILMADSVLITDYNTRNIDSYVKKKVIKNSEYAPKFYPMNSKLGSVEVKFKQEFNNQKKFRN